MPLNGVTRRLQLAARGLTERRNHHRILRTVPEEDRRCLVGGYSLGVEPCRQHRIAREGDDAGEPLRVAYAAEERHRTPLREAREHDACASDAARVLAADQLRDYRL